MRSYITLSLARETKTSELFVHACNKFKLNNILTETWQWALAQLLLWESEQKSKTHKLGTQGNCQ